MKTGLFLSSLDSRPLILLVEIIFQQFKGSCKRTHLVVQYLFLCGFELLFFVLVKAVLQLLVDGFIHPVFRLLPPAAVKIAVLLGFAAIVQDIFPNSIDARPLVCRAGHDLRGDTRFVWREKVQGGLQLYLS